MWKLLRPGYNLDRRWFGTYTLEDPRPAQKEAPYTFFLPSVDEISSLKPGDDVKLIFCGYPSGLEWDTERMWVTIKAFTDKEIVGVLNNDPFDMPQLKADDPVKFQRFHIISTDVTVEHETPVQYYWDRCLVDDCVLYESVPVYYIYREEPDMAQPDDKYPDSGWRIRGDYRHISDEEFDSRKHSYIALGKVLNADDSWIGLIDSPVGSAFMRNFETSEYEIYDHQTSDDD